MPVSPTINAVPGSLVLAHAAPFDLDDNDGSSPQDHKIGFCLLLVRVGSESDRVEGHCVVVLSDFVEETGNSTFSFTSGRSFDVR
jgi:hypothetical protein